MRFGQVKPPKTKPLTHDQLGEELFAGMVIAICVGIAIILGLS